MIKKIKNKNQQIKQNYEDITRILQKLNHLHNYDDDYYSPHWMKPACIVQLFKITCIKKHFQENITYNLLLRWFSRYVRRMFFAPIQ
ncbi:hypothetical protein T05_12296 [Trichinella murrelli]|uniref:Uncharacterized protein n=1 Tax=Trichinella murrelli TaxID=144512 RepID=A0A0V0TNN3_9BILA|nr:hypothetical protein T05_12296 [Trichinella murrelli]